MKPKKRRQRRADRLNQASLEDIIRENPDLFRGGNVNLIGEAEIEGTYGEVNQRRRRRKQEFIEDLPNVGGEVTFELARMLPLLGDAIDVAEVGKAAATGKDFYENEASPEALAGLAAAGLLVPNIIEKPLKRAFKPLKRLFSKADNVSPKTDIPNRTGFGKESKWHPGIKFLPDSKMTDAERAYHAELNRLKNEIDSDEGRERVRKMITEEVKHLADDPNTPTKLRQQLSDLLFDRDLMDMKVQEVFYGGRNKGFMNTSMKQADAKNRASYNTVRNNINPDEDLMSADHEMAHSIQHNILEALGVDTKKVFRTGERTDLQKQGFRSHGARGLTLDRDILQGVQMTDDPSLLRPRTDNRRLRAKRVKKYAEEGLDVDVNNPDNPSEAIRLENALRGHRTNEPYPLLAGERRMMIEQGVLPTRYTPVTEGAVERFRGTPMGNLVLMAPTNFQSPTTRSFANRRIAELMNRMPALIPALASAGYLSSKGQQEN